MLRYARNNYSYSRKELHLKKRGISFNTFQNIMFLIHSRIATQDDINGSNGKNIWKNGTDESPYEPN
jgi:hypothetical protein